MQIPGQKLIKEMLFEVTFSCPDQLVNPLKASKMIIFQHLHFSKMIISTDQVGHKVWNSLSQARLRSNFPHVPILLSYMTNKIGRAHSSSFQKLDLERWNVATSAILETLIKTTFK